MCAQWRLRSACAITGHILESQGCNNEQNSRICRLIWVFVQRTCQKERFLPLRIFGFKELVVFVLPSVRIWVYLCNWMNDVWQSCGSVNMSYVNSAGRDQPAYLCKSFSCHRKVLYYPMIQTWKTLINLHQSPSSISISNFRQLNKILC